MISRHTNTINVHWVVLLIQCWVSRKDDEEWRGWIARKERFPTNHLVLSSSLEVLIESLPAPPTDKPDRLQHESRKREVYPIVYGDNPSFHPRNQQQAHYHHGFDNEDNDNDNVSILRVEAEFPVHQQHADHQHVTRSPKRSPSFIGCPNGTLYRVLSRKNSQKILVTSFMDLENVLLLQGQFCSRRLRQMSEVPTHDAWEQALLQGPKAPEFVSTLLRLYHLLQPLLIQSNHFLPPEVFIENCYTYKQQE